MQSITLHFYKKNNWKAYFIGILNMCMVQVICRAFSNEKNLRSLEATEYQPDKKNKKISLRHG